MYYTVTGGEHGAPDEYGFATLREAITCAQDQKVILLDMGYSVTGNIWRDRQYQALGIDPEYGCRLVPLTIDVIRSPDSYEHYLDHAVRNITYKQARI